jgi:hypothetical protein
MREETAEHCRLLREFSSSGHDNASKWFMICFLLIFVASLLAQTELKVSSKESNSVPPTKWASTKADVTSMSPENSAKTDIVAASQDTAISVNSSIRRSIIIALIWQAIQLILILYMGRNAAKTIELIGNQFYCTAIVLLAFAEFMILLSIDAVQKALSRAQAGERRETHKILELSSSLALFALLWPWYSLWSASRKH